MIPSSGRMAGLWSRSHAELAGELWAVPAERAGVWVLVQSVSCYLSSTSFQISPSSFHLPRPAPKGDPDPPNA